MIHLWIYLRPRTKISRKESNRLKDQIRKRLQREDYSCRLSDPPINVNRPGYKWLTRRLDWLVGQMNNFLNKQ